MTACVENSRTQMENRIRKYINFSGRRCSNLVSCLPSSRDLDDPCTNRVVIDSEEAGNLWLKIREEAQSDMEQEPILSSYYISSVLSHNSLESALAYQLAQRLGSHNLSANVLYNVFAAALEENEEVIRAVREDLKAARERDPVCISLVHCLLHFKGFLAIQAHRVANRLWTKGRKPMALLIQSRVSEVFGVDIHPGATIGKGILLDHATGVVIGETAIVGNNVSILHNVTLGGTGKVSGDRHPKIGNGVLVGAGAQILGNVRIGDRAKIGAGSVVLKEVPRCTTAVGNPARLVGGKARPTKLDKLPSFTMDHTSFVQQCADYVI